MRNKIVGITDWSGVCQMARLLTNGLSRRPREEHLYKGWYEFPRNLGAYPRLDLVYIATDSIGDRKWAIVPGEDPVDKQKSADGEYLGWAENQSLGFEFTSATSGAQIQIEKIEGGWKMTFEGTEAPDAKKESDYLRRFLQVHFVKLLEIEVNRKDLLITPR